MHLVPEPGDMIPLETGNATILEVQNYAGNIRVLALREHPVHPFAVWHWDPVNGASMESVATGVLFTNVATPGFTGNDAYVFALGR